MSLECQVNVKSQSELDLGGRETCIFKSQERPLVEESSFARLSLPGWSTEQSSQEMCLSQMMGRF